MRTFVYSPDHKIRKTTESDEKPRACPQSGEGISLHISRGTSEYSPATSLTWVLRLGKDSQWPPLRPESHWPQLQKQSQWPQLQKQVQWPHLLELP